MSLAVNYFHPISNVIFHLIDPGKRVLDVGCGTGRLCEKLKAEKNCCVVGIEVDEGCAELLKQRCDQVIIADVEEVEDLPFPAEYFDVIVFADVLEHLRNPSLPLTSFKKYLHRDGFIVVSTPNVANWLSRLKLLFGKWDYKERGLMDRTHLRFYTLKTARRMIEESGYEIVFSTCTSGHSGIDWRKPIRNPSNLWKNFLAHNFIFKAVKADSRRSVATAPMIS